MGAVGQGYAMLRESGADIVIGSRKLHPEGYAGYPFIRKVMSRGLNLLLRILCGFKLSDSQSGIKGFTREAARTVFPLCVEDRWSFDLEMLMAAGAMGMRIAEMPVKVVDHSRASKVRVVRDSVRTLKAIFRIRRRVGGR
jgi:hypothetical protein